MRFVGVYTIWESMDKSICDDLAKKIIDTKDCMSMGNAYCVKSA